jgi:Fe-S-cluster-containing dehydrogenase component/CRP-like cAMP-binding protein
LANKRSENKFGDTAGITLPGYEQVLEKPKRWDLPFSQDLPNELERRDITEEELDQLLNTPPFLEMDASHFPKSLPLREILRNDTRIRLYRNGDAVVRAGDYGNAAFLILDGECRAIVDGLDQTVLGRKTTSQKSVFQSLANIFTNPKSPEVRDASKYPQFSRDNIQQKIDGSGKVFVQDVPNVLDIVPDAFETTNNNTMEQGTVFGELGALGRVQRAVTVVAASDGENRLLQIRWQGLRDLMKYDDALREHVNQLFRSRSLLGALQSSPLLQCASLTRKQWDQVVEEAEFETFGSYNWYGTYQQLRERDVDPLSQEPIIAEQGQYPNGLIMVRAGFGRLSQKHGHGEHTFGYLGKGDVYGLEELMHNVDADTQLPLQSTLRAAGYMDIVRIPTRTFEKVIYPSLKEARDEGYMPVSIAGEQIARMSEKVAESKASETTIAKSKDDNFDPAVMEFLVENRFINGTQTMLIDLDRCTRCDDCIRACASGHDNNPRFVRHGRIHGNYMVANACMHCEDPVCMIGCPTGAIHRSEGKGEVVINDLTCIGCNTCANSCPYDNIRMVNVRNKSDESSILVDPVNGRPIVKATKCDLCVEHHGGPACERACPHDALKRVDMNDLDFLSEWFNR